MIRLDKEAMDAFEDALANPPEPNEELRKLMTQHSSDMVEKLRKFACVYAVTADMPEIAGDLPEHAFYEAAETIEELVAERDALAKRIHDLEGDVLAYRKTMDVMVEDEAARLEEERIEKLRAQTQSEG